MAEKFSQQAVLEPGVPALTGRATLGATIGNMLERFRYLQLFRHPDWPHILPFAEPIRQPDAVAGDVRGRIRHPADRRARYRGPIRIGWDDGPR